MLIEINERTTLGTFAENGKVLLVIHDHDKDATTGPEGEALAFMSTDHARRIASSLCIIADYIDDKKIEAKIVAED